MHFKATNLKENNIGRSRTNQKDWAEGRLEDAAIGKRQRHKAIQESKRKIEAAGKDPYRLLPCSGGTKKSRGL